MSKQEIEELAAQNPDEVLPDPIDPQPQDEEQPEAAAEELLRVTVRATGKQYVGKTEKDILAQMTEDFERMATDAQSRESQRREVQGKIRYQEERQPQGEQYDDQKYLDLLGKDTLAARRYQDRFYYGLAEDEDPAAVVSFSYRLADRVADTLEMAEFQRMNKGADGKPLIMSDSDAATFLREFDKEGIPVTARNLTGVYHDLLNRGVIQRTAPTGNIKDIEFERPKSRGEGAPRATGGGSGTTSGTKVDYESMSFTELQKQLRKEGVLKH